MRFLVYFTLIISVCALALTGCGSADDSTADSTMADELDPISLDPIAPDAIAMEHERIAFGGRLFDMWYDDIDTDFVPDDPDTPAIDGRGGPNGNGTLNNAEGIAIPNNGHSYRFKNLLGWDMRGNAGIYGAEYQAKEFILPTGPLSPQHADDSRDDWIERVTNGFGGLPAYGSVMTPPQIETLVDYMLAVRDGAAPSR